MKRAALTAVLLVGLKKEFCDATREHHLEETKGHQIFNLKNTKKKTNKQHHENKKQNTRKKKLWENQIYMVTKIKGIEEGNREAMRQT